MTSTDTRAVRAQLEEERARLQALVEDLAGGPPAQSWTGTLGSPGDVVDAASVRSARTDAETLAAATQQRLERIGGALARIDEGTYGSCEVCGEPIGAERLEALPFTTLCRDDVGVARSA